jgi:hypothetical protein
MPNINIARFFNLDCLFAVHNCHDFKRQPRSNKFIESYNILDKMFFFHDQAIHLFFIKRKIVNSTIVHDHASEEPSLYNAHVAI